MYHSSTNRHTQHAHIHLFWNNDFCSLVTKKFSILLYNINNPNGNHTTAQRILKIQENGMKIVEDLRIWVKLILKITLNNQSYERFHLVVVIIINVCLFQVVKNCSWI